MNRFSFLILSTFLFLGFTSCSSDEKEGSKDEILGEFFAEGQLSGSFSEIYHLYVDYTLQTPKETITKTMDITSGNLGYYNQPTPCTFTYKLYLKAVAGKTVDANKSYDYKLDGKAGCKVLKNGKYADGKSEMISFNHDVDGAHVQEFVDMVNNDGASGSITISADGVITEK